MNRNKFEYSLDQILLKGNNLLECVRETPFTSDWQNAQSESDFDNQAEISSTGCIRLIRALHRANRRDIGLRQFAPIPHFKNYCNFLIIHFKLRAPFVSDTTNLSNKFTHPNECTAFRIYLVNLDISDRSLYDDVPSKHEFTRANYTDKPIAHINYRDTTLIDRLVIHYTRATHL